MGTARSGHGGRKTQGIEDGIFPVKEERGALPAEKRGLGPGRGFGAEQGEQPTVQKFSLFLPQTFLSQEQHDLPRAFLENLKKPVEKLDGNARFLFCLGHGSFHAQGQKGKERLDRVGEEGDHVHRKDGVGGSAGDAFQAQDIHVIFRQTSSSCIP